MADDQQTDGAAVHRPINLEAGRRAFLKTAGMGTALAAMAAVTTGEAQAQSQASADYDVAILNFALNLEYLEAEFYQRAVYGVGLDASLTTGVGTQGGGVRGGSRVPFKNSVVQNIAAEIANDEKNHVLFLRSALGSKAVAEPVISLDDSFTALAAAAGLPSSFNPYGDDFSFLLAAYVFEDVGTTAYNGAAPFITSKTTLATASSIFAAEAYHLGTIRTLLASQQNAFYGTATALISAARAKLSGALDDQGIGADQSTLGGGFPSPINITDTDPNSLAFARTPRQVLNVVYGAQGAQQGGFFPDGVNGENQVRQLVRATRG